MKRNLPFTYSEFKSIYSKVPRLCVDLVIQTEKGLLLTYRVKNGWKNMWHMPGGTVYYQESIKSAVKRIAKEEIGVDVKIGNFLGLIEWKNTKKEVGFGHVVSLAYLCKPKSLAFSHDDQTEKIRFFKRIPKDTINEHRYFLNSLSTKKLL